MPFRRATWVYENVSDIKLPDPPNNVSIDEFKSNEETKTFKESTLIHAKNPQCNSCHKKIDPLAFAIHNFDTMGRRIKKQDTVIENELVDRISSAQKTIASAFTLHLISYIVGRETTVFDKTTVNKI